MAVVYKKGEYWRIKVTETAAGDAADSVKIAELDWRAVAGAAGDNSPGDSWADYGVSGYAFDGLAATSWDAGGESLPQVIGVIALVYPAETVIELMVKADAVDASTAPSKFTIEQSEDGGATWIVRKTISTPAAWTTGEERVFSIASANTAPVITSDGGGATASISIVENTTAVTTVVATDAEYDVITYSIVGGADYVLFTIDGSSGVLEFIAAPDYENPTNSMLDNLYEVTVQASDGNGGTDSQAITVTVTDVAEAKPGTNWSRVVTIGGVDVSASVTGEAIVEAEESTSKIASFLLRPEAGTISAGDWLGADVTISYKVINSSGATLSNDVIFVGTVDQALYDPNTRLTAFDCSDDMQARFEAMTKAVIDVMITNSRWSEAVFGDYTDGWRYLENVLGTYPQSYDYNRDGVTGTLVDWKAKLIPDFSYDSSAIIYGSISYSITPKRELFNSYEITYNYRYGRLLHRDHTFNWSLAFCPYFARSHELPTREMITTAATSAGWNLSSTIAFDALPLSAADPCGGGISWSISDENRELLALGARWMSSKRWTQSVTENYTINVKAPQSIAWLGEIAFKEVASNSTDLDSDGWTDGVKTPAGRVNSQGDIVQDRYDRVISSNDIETLIARARTEILASHRANYVQADIELNPLLERFHTVKLDDNGLVGQGKVFSFIHRMNSDTGEAITTVKVAVSLNGGGAEIGNSTISSPSAPDTDPETVSPAKSSTLSTHIGGDDTVDNFNENWDGLTGNYSITVGLPTDAQFYPRRFKVETPDINQDAIDSIEGSVSSSYTFNIPNEILMVTVA